MNGTIHDCHGYTYTDPGASAYVCPGARTHTYVLENMMVTIPGAFVAWKIVLILLCTLLLALVVKEINTFILYLPFCVFLSDFITDNIFCLKFWNEIGRVFLFFISSLIIL